MHTKTTKIIDCENNLLKPFLGKEPSGCFTETLNAFIAQQKTAWPKLKAALQNLDEQMIKDVFLSDLEVRLHHNPHRIKSSASKVDKVSISERPCFLCTDNLYDKQLALCFHEDWLILNNPYPIFKDHLVVSHKDHILQDINTALPAMIKFVQDTDFSFSAFYNGPACGASAPDHLHFQACRKYAIPIIDQTEKIINANNTSSLSIINTDSSSRSFAGTLDNRGIFICSTKDSETLLSKLIQIISYLGNSSKSSDEPLINIILSGKDNTYTAILFPRKAHRPECFFQENPDKLLISPGAVDIGGSIILPRKADYDTINKQILLNIFSEVCFDHSVFQNLSF